MLTIDDCNTILAKYTQDFWVDYDFQQIGWNVGTTYEDNFVEIKIVKRNGQDTIVVNTKNGLMWSGYFLKHNGDVYLDKFLRMDTVSSFSAQKSLFPDDDVILRMRVTTEKLRQGFMFYLSFVPDSSLRIPVVNGEFDDKFYVKSLTAAPLPFFVNDTEVELETDENGTYITLPSSDDCIIYNYNTNTGYNFLPFKVTFLKFKELPIPYIPTLYKGTPQSIQVINSEDDDPISDYQTYYQGRQLKDNTIQLPYDSEDYVDIMVDLKDYRYPFCTLKLKAPTTLYTANSQGDVETAIENGIQTLQVGDNQTEVTLNSITLSNVTLINSNIQLTDSTITDCQIIDTTYTDNGGNNITNTIFNSVDYINTAQSNYNEVTFTECDIHDSEINLTGTISKSTITDSLILSDGVINIQDNTFTGVGLKEYFPSHLYLTGDYTVTGNTFTLTGEWTELEYNMCIIKATNDFNPSNFIKQNNLQLNITYESEPVNTFYYNLVDEDKIRAVRL